MQGLNTEEVKALVAYIAQNNSWEHLYDSRKRKRKIPKYYTMTYDSRTNDMWRIEFNQIIGDDCKIDESVVFRTEKGCDLKTEIYNWLEERAEK